MADIAEGRAAFRDPSAQVNDTLTLICGFVDVERSNHAFPMLMDRINRVRLPSSALLGLANVVLLGVPVKR